MEERKTSRKVAVPLLMCIVATCVVLGAFARTEENYNVIATLEPSEPKGLGAYGGDLSQAVCTGPNQIFRLKNSILRFRYRISQEF